MLNDLSAPTTLVFSSRSNTLALWEDLLSTWEESVRLWHFVSFFSLGADLPEDRCDAEDDGCHDGRIGLPVVWLRIPTTCESTSSAESAIHRAQYGIDLPDGDQTCLG